MTHSSSEVRVGWWSRVRAAIRYVAQQDPVRVQAVIRATLFLAAAVLGGFGVAVPEGVEPWAIGVVVAFYALVEAVTTAATKRRTEASAAVVEVARGGDVVAGEASELPTGTVVRPVGSLGGGAFPQ